MLGTGTLLRILGRGGIKVSDRFGILPPRWFLRQALQALSEDDIPLVIEALRRIRRRSRRRELIRQQALFRCRVLKDSHALSLLRLERITEAGFLRGRSESHSEAAKLHRLAIRNLSSYERQLQDLTV